MIALLATLLLAPAPPEPVSLAWQDDRHVILSWTQRSDANMRYIEKVTAGHIVTLRTIAQLPMRWHKTDIDMETPIPPYGDNPSQPGEWWPQAGEPYYITEQRLANDGGLEWSATYGPFVLGCNCRVFAPLMRNE